jgi:hypothetical protein
MKTEDFTTRLLVNTTPAEAFKAINNVKAWWSSTLKGHSEKLNDAFFYQYKDMHRSTQKLVEVIPDKRVVWLISDCMLSFVQKKDEWDGTTVSFDLSQKGDQTEIVFTHYGLVPAVECFDACCGGWNHYLHKSLVPLINTGKGNPD